MMSRMSSMLSICAVCQAALQAQMPPQPAVPMGFQPAQTLVARGGRGVAAMPIPRAETGKPFSATVTTQTVQTLLDGTHLSQTTTMLEYRDAEGRVRTETGPASGRGAEPFKTIVIRDPVAGVMWRLNPATHSATKVEMPIVSTARGARAGRAEVPVDPTVRMSQDVTQHVILGRERNNSTNVTEDLGTINVNGVPARGTRFTTVVPAGAIGNDREFRSVEERWFSSELNLLIKSVTTDPRFGTTTYELTNISRQAPEPSLFQVPTGFNTASSNTIEAIEFSGASRNLVETMRSTILTRTGDLYSEEAVGRDVKLLWNTGRFNDVQVRRETGPRGGVLLRFTLTERP